MSRKITEKVYLRVYTREKAIVAAVCDKDQLGCKYKEGQFILDVSPKFYGGDLVDIPYALTQIKKATMANLVGSTIVNAAIEAELIHPDAIHQVQGIPHAQRMTI